jgi:hypothetical protein
MTICVFEFCAYYKRELFFLLRNGVAEGIWVNFHSVWRPGDGI